MVVGHYENSVLQSFVSSLLSRSLKHLQRSELDPKKENGPCIDRFTSPYTAISIKSSCSSTPRNMNIQKSYLNSSTSHWMILNHQDPLDGEISYD